MMNHQHHSNSNSSSCMSKIRALVFGFLILSSWMSSVVVVSATNANDESNLVDRHASQQQQDRRRHHRQLQQQSPVATTTARKGSPPPPPPPRTCNDAISFSFQRKVLLTLEGRPGKVTYKDVDAIQKSLQRAYNQVGDRPVRFACHRNGTIRAAYTFDKVMIDKYQFVPFRQSLSGNLSQPFTIYASIQGHCKACLANSAFQMFTNDVDTTTRRRRLSRSSLPEARSEPYSSSSSSSSSSSTYDRDLAVTTQKAPKNPPYYHYLPPCQCAPPSKKEFIQVSNVNLARRKTVSTPISLLAWQELVVHPCSSTVTVIEAFVTLNFETPVNESSTTTIVLNSTIQSQLLARYISQYYNSANALRTTGQVCDTTFLTLAGTAQAILAPEAKRSSRNRRNRHRHLASAVTSSKSLSTLYKISGTCRSCPKSTKLFNDAVSKGRRRLLREWGGYDDNAYDDDDDDDELYTTTNAITILHEQEVLYHHRQLPVLDDICYCPVNSTSFDPPQGSEYLQTLNTQLDVLATSGYLSIVGPAQATVQVKQVNCSADVKSFSTRVSITVLRVNDTTGSNSIYNTSLTRGDEAALENEFAFVYNFLQSHFYCDPFFRTVAKVQLVESVSFRRELKGKKVAPTYNFTELVFNVTGTCRGCNPINTTLFQDTSLSRRRLVQRLVSGDDFLTATSDELVDTRRLQEQQPTICYCPVSVVREGAPTLGEMVTAFNQTIAILAKLILSIADEDKTLPPTPSPTELPTKLPTKFPTTAPTAFPTTLPTELPTSPPTEFPTSSPTEFPTSSPTEFPTTSPTALPTTSPTALPTPPQ